MNTLLTESFRDAQTSVSSLSAAIAGSAADRIAQMIISQSGLASTQGAGQTGLKFIIRALVSSASFGLTARFLPGTSENIFFSVLFFAANPGLIQDGVLLGRTAVDALSGMTQMQYAPGPMRSKGPLPCHKKTGCN